MNDRALKVLEQYDLEILGTRRGRGSYICETPQGLRILCDYQGTENKAQFQNMVMKKIRSGGYEKVETLKLLEGLVDVWLPDYKYRSRELARRLSRAEDYPEQAARALDEMVRQAGGEAFAADGRMLRGVIVRHLVLPGQKEDSKAVVRFLRERYGDRIYLSLLKQYTPLPRMRAWPQLNRRVTTYEYRQVVDYALSLGVTKGYMQKGETAKESFIPAFDGQGVARGKDESDEISDICGGRVSGGQPDS